MDKKKYKYSVALSFSGKQRSYVEQVSNELTRLNVQHFYDYNEQENLWGKDLARYLDKIYYEDSEYFIPFISKEYVETVWPNLELSAALDRNMNDFRPDFQKYILPVYFDDIRVNGIPKSVGYYDANKVTPEALAKAIYRKVLSVLDESQYNNSSKKTDKFIANCKKEFYNVNTKLIESVNDDYVSQIYDTCNNLFGSRIVVIYGERGLGKRSCVSRALSKIKDKSLHYIQPCYENCYKYGSIIQSLNLDTNNIFSQHDLDFESGIKRKIISKFIENPCVVYIEHFHEFDEESRKMLYDVATSLIMRYAGKDVCLIFEFDSDVSNNLIELFYEMIPSQTKLLEIGHLSHEEIRACFFNYCDDIKISDENLAYIVRSSLGNIMYLNVIVNYLHGAGYIYEIEGQLTCRSLPEGTLSDVLKKYLLQRYERLDEFLKELLSKSSVVGNIFSAELLENPFQIINAAEKLSDIEKISNLIEHCDNKTYAFETEDVHNLILSNVSNEQQKEWHNILALYFQRILSREKKRKKLLTIDKTIFLVYSIASHFKSAAEYQSALPYYLELVSQYSKLCDYTNKLKTIKNIQFILNQIELEENELDKMEIDIMIWRADCYKGLGQYTKARELYDELLEFIDDETYSQILIDAYYNKSYCSYMMGKVIEAQEILYLASKKLNLRENHKKDYIRIISLLASICDSTNDSTTQRKFYIESLTYYRENKHENEYYELLKMASMVFDEAIAIDMEKEAEIFFRSNQNIRNLAETLHNIATTELYLNRTKHINSHLTESILLFDTFGSKAVHYPLNTKGIVQMIIEENYDDAISTFASALSSSTEVYSEIAIRTNLTQCLIQLGKFHKAYQQIVLIDSLIDTEPHGVVPVYETFHLLNWAIFFFHSGDYEKCEEYIKKLIKQNDIEDRHKYFVKALRYSIRKRRDLKARNTAGTSPYPIYNYCVEKGLIFATLRFFE